MARSLFKLLARDMKNLLERNGYCNLLDSDPNMITYEDSNGRVIYIAKIDNNEVLTYIEGNNSQFSICNEDDIEDFIKFYKELL